MRGLLVDPTCSPSLAKFADRIEGDTRMSFLENRSTLLVALTETDWRPALRCALQALLRRCPCMQLLLEAAKEAIVRSAKLISCVVALSGNCLVQETEFCLHAVLEFHR